jgi:hypothetical protein
LLKTLRERGPEFVLLDGTLAGCHRVGDSRADYSAKHRRHGVNVQVVTDPAGEVLWISPALPGRTHDLTAARAHRIIRICERQGVPILAAVPESTVQVVCRARWMSGDVRAVIMMSRGGPAVPRPAGSDR